MWLLTASRLEKLTWSFAPTKMPWPPCLKTRTTCVHSLLQFQFLLHLLHFLESCEKKNTKSLHLVLKVCLCSMSQSIATSSCSSIPRLVDLLKWVSVKRGLQSSPWQHWRLSSKELFPVHRKHFKMYLWLQSSSGRGGCYYGNSGGGGASRNSGLRGSYWSWLTMCEIMTLYPGHGRIVPQQWRV